TFTLAVNRTFSVQSGKKEADFVSVIAWRKIAENIANYLSKGNQAAGKRTFRTVLCACRQ
ncbi:MAG: single-stranded DNA-binding protein, partial [Bacillus sp. (in: Bacteria)]|nr:single-stranded DNA-binding protein [Bacillus sp. (in: firmicutes)]